MSVKSLLQLALEGLIAQGDLQGKISNYSGRFMRGEHCLGYVIPDVISESPTYIGVLLADWAITPGNFRMCEDEPASDKLALLLAEVSCMRHDAMGKGYILYWPTIPFGTINAPLPGCLAGYHLQTCSTMGCGGCKPLP